MKEIPILFSTEMVKAILLGRKTQTRREIKEVHPDSKLLPYTLLGTTFLEPEEFDKPEDDQMTSVITHRFGKPGDLLWVRETFLRLDKDHVITTPFAYKANADADTEELRKDYIKAGRSYNWKPSIHMPKAAARIWLKVVSITPEKLHFLGEEDAKNEGVISTFCTRSRQHHFLDYLKKGAVYNSAWSSFMSLWISINGQESWERNPWVWRIEFEVVSKTGKP